MNALLVAKVQTPAMVLICGLLDAAPLLSVRPRGIASKPAQRCGLIRSPDPKKDFPLPLQPPPRPRKRNAPRPLAPVPLADTFGEDVRCWRYGSSYPAAVCWVNSIPR
ncbi:hypothetical protein GCM10020229_82620 [Kitasatospora albolonga]